MNKKISGIVSMFCLLISVGLGIVGKFEPAILIAVLAIFNQINFYLGDEE